MSGCRSLTSALYCWRISALDWLSCASRISSARRSVGGRPALRAAAALAAGVQRRLVAEQLHRVVEAEALPGAALGVRLRRRRGRAASPNGRVGRPQTRSAANWRSRSCVGMAVEEVPLADCTRARGRGRTSGIRRGCPGDFGARNLPGLVAAGPVAGAAPRSRPRRTRRARGRAASCRRSTEMSNSKGERRVMVGRCPRLAGDSGAGVSLSRHLPGGPRPVAGEENEMSATDGRMAEILRDSWPQAFAPEQPRGDRREREPPRPRRLARGRRDAFPRGDARRRASTASAASSAAAPCTGCWRRSSRAACTRWRSISA